MFNKSKHGRTITKKEMSVKKIQKKKKKNCNKMSDSKRVPRICYIEFLPFQNYVQITSQLEEMVA